MNNMEKRPWKQPDFWPKSIDDINRELKLAAEKDRREGKDIASKEETNKLFGHKEAEKTYSREESSRKMGELKKTFEEKEN